LKLRNQQYTKEVEAFLNAAKKGDAAATRAPRNADEFMPLLHGLLLRLVEAKEQEIDILRADAGLGPHAERAGLQRVGYVFTPIEELGEDESAGEDD
jgi:hypothetical protein